MKISEKQLQIMLLTLRESFSKNIVGMFTISHDERYKIYLDIINQQSDELKEVGE